MQVGPNHWSEAKAADPKGKLYGARTAVRRLTEDGQKVSAALDLCDKGPHKGSALVYLVAGDGSWAGTRYNPQGQIEGHVAGLSTKREVQKRLWSERPGTLAVDTMDDALASADS